MTGRTHLLLGVNSVWLFRLVPESPGGDLGLLVLAAALGALLPDLDAADSTIKSLRIVGDVRPFALPALLLHRAFGHRGLLHSLLGLAGLGVLVCLPLSLWWGGEPSLALGLGYASHLLGDAATKSGIPLLFPDRRRRHLLASPLRLTTGSQAEDVVFALLAGGALALLLTTGLG